MTKKIILNSLFGIAVTALIFGMLFHKMHWPYSLVLMITSLSCIMILYFIRFLMKENRDVIDSVKLIVVISWSISGMFTLAHLEYKLPTYIISTLAAMVWLVMEGVNYIKLSKENKEYTVSTLVSNTLFISGSILISIGSFFKILHWPYATYFLISGFLLAVIWVFKDIVVSKK